MHISLPIKPLIWPRNWENAARGQGELPTRDRNSPTTRALAETVAAILRAAIFAYPHTFPLQHLVWSCPRIVRRSARPRPRTRDVVL